MLGVANYALWAAGCAAPKPAADPISRWEFDEISSAEGVFQDRGPAHVLMVHAGQWADLTTASLVVGDDDTSAYTDGSAYATIAAGVAAHNLGALTISLYYQRAAAANKHILLAAGDGSAAGDFSLEVLANGRLRGYHTGQDGTLRYFEDQTGITGTNLQVGTAHRIDLSLGSQGARIYLDGAELGAAAIAANSNGWNNARVKYLGRWTDGVQGQAVGVFDRLRIWNRQLTGAEIAELEAAQSISLPGQSGPPGDALSVPSLAEWLVSDQPDPTPTKYVSNQTRGNGSGSSPANAQEVQAALNGAAPGQTFLAVCQTPGTIEHWSYPNGLSFPSGSAGNHITLQARNGDGIVINAGEAYGGARTKNSGFWTQSGLSGDDIAKQIWRSTSTFSGGAQGMIGTWIEFDHPHFLFPYGSMTDLRATYGTADSPTNYAGPGARQDADGRVYIRFQRPHVGKYSDGGTWTKCLWPNNPEAVNGSGQLVYPISQDPNHYVIHLAQQSTPNTDCFKAASGAGAGGFKIGAGINSCGFRRTLQLGVRNVQMDRGTHLFWQIGVGGASSSSKLENCFFNRTRFSCGSMRHLSRAEFKFGGPLEPIRSVFFFRLSWARDVYFLNCTMADTHEWGVMGAAHTNDGQVRFRNCCVFNLLDEGLQGRVGLSRFELGYCFFLNAGFWGQGVNGSEDMEWDPGKWFIHHNVIDCRVQNCYDWRLNPGPQKIAFRHSPDGQQPQKIYNNTLFWGPDQEEQGELGIQHLRQWDVTATGAAAAHEVFNNLCIRHDTQRYNPEYSQNLTAQTDWAGGWWKVDADFTNEFWDYNLYYRDVPGPLVDGLIDNVQNRAATGSQDYATMAAWRASAQFATSKLAGTLRGAYTPGFEGNGTDAKPALPSLDDFPDSRFLYRPSATSAVTVATSTSLSSANWWSTPPSWGDDYFGWSAGGGSLAPSAWKGALDPNGSTITVGVLNP
jgi:hypothetical protein